MRSPAGRRQLAATVVAAVIMVGCGDGAAPTDAPTGLESAACPQVERPPLQSGSHLIGTAEPPVPYSSTPATSGWHTTGVPSVGIHETPLSDPEIVTLLELGVVVVAHAPAATVDEEVAAQLVAQFPDRLAITPYAPSMPSEIALLTWGVVARCDALDPAAVTEFVLDWRAGPDSEGH